MKTLNLVVVLLALLSLSASNSFSQNKDTKTDSSIIYKTGKPADWPKENDAVIAAPRNHKILLENENVRVLDVTVLPGETEAVHSHRWPSVLYMAFSTFWPPEISSTVTAKATSSSTLASSKHLCNTR